MFGFPWFLCANPKSGAPEVGGGRRAAESKPGQGGPRPSRCPGDGDAATQASGVHPKSRRRNLEIVEELEPGNGTLS